MTDAELLAKIKNGLGITGTFQNDTLSVYIEDVKAFMLSAGVLKKVVDSEVSVGCIMRGVADLWNYGSGNASLSDYFKMRLIQLKNSLYLFITQATGTTVTVTRNGETIANNAILTKGDILTITVTGGTVEVNGEDFTSGESYTVAGIVEIESEVANG